MTKIQRTEGAMLLREKIEKLIRASKGTLARRDIAKKLGVDSNTLIHWVKERRRPTIDQAVEIKKLMKIRVETWTMRPTA